MGSARLGKTRIEIQLDSEEMKTLEELCELHHWSRKKFCEIQIKEVLRKYEEEKKLKKKK